ncbi:MAG: VanW family protein [Chloroflexota bacterium]|nr:VanW family protein [Chloroflexota bacterium]
MSYAAPSSQPQPRHRTSLILWSLRFVLLSAIGAVMLALLLSILLIAWQLVLRDRVVPGVHVGGVDLGGLTAAEAAAALNEEFAPLTEKIYVLRDGERAWPARGSELGLRIATEDMLGRAFAVGHSGAAFDDIIAQSEAWISGQRQPARLILDENVALDYLRLLASRIKRDRQDASLVIVDGTAQVLPGETGRALNIPTTLARLTATLRASAAGTDIEVAVDERGPRLWNVEEAALRLGTALSAPVQLFASDRDGGPLGPWTVSPEQIRALLSVSLREDGPGKRFDVSVNAEAFAEFLRSLAPGLIIIPVDGRFDFNPGTGELIALSPSRGGRELNIEKTLEQLERAIFSRESRLAPMVFDYSLPRYHEGVAAAALGIKELVAEATTYYWGSSQNRRRNIAVGAGKLNGIIIAPGEEFAFNHHLGDITPEAGFVDGAVIFGARTVTGIGGGICQVSTTVFRAAFGGGFAISERNSHGYRVGYYEYAGAGPGLDAAIWQPTSDLRFLNNTPHHLLIESEFMGAKDALQFRFYSTRHWRTVVEPPVIRDIVEAPPPRFEENRALLAGQARQVDYAAQGADVWVYRNVYDSEGNLVKRDQAYTHYSPWQAVFEVAPGDPRLEAEADAE